MTQIQGLWWPDDVGEKWRHSLKHVRVLETSLALCPTRRTAVQAGGNIGLWPRRMAASFRRVFTFEPEPISRACLEQNVPANVTVSAAAIGSAPGWCSIERRSLGSHKVIDGTDVPVTTIDVLALEDLDLLQLDIEGYEWHALTGARETIQRCHPVIHVELRGFSDQYGNTETAIRRLLTGWGYVAHGQLSGNDVVFAWGMP